MLVCGVFLKQEKMGSREWKGARKFGGCATQRLFDNLKFPYRKFSGFFGANFQTFYALSDIPLAQSNAHHISSNINPAGEYCTELKACKLKMLLKPALEDSRTLRVFGK